MLNSYPVTEFSVRSEQPLWTTIMHIFFLNTLSSKIVFKLKYVLFLSILR